jgi:hypothetical protein
MASYNLRVNGEARVVDADPDTPMLYVLRDNLALKGPKFGCGGSLSFAITSPSVHSVQRPENINNLYPVVTSRREGKRANTHRD